MHSIHPETNGWEQEVISDGSSRLYASPESVPPPGSLEGCSHIVLTKKNDPDLPLDDHVPSNPRYVARIRFEERQRDTYVNIEAVVIRSDGDVHRESTEGDVLYFRHNVFDGNGAKSKAARYVHQCKGEIDRFYFSPKPQSS